MLDGLVFATGVVAKILRGRQESALAREDGPSQLLKAEKMSRSMGSRQMAHRDGRFIETTSFTRKSVKIPPPVVTMETRLQIQPMPSSVPGGLPGGIAPVDFGFCWVPLAGERGHCFPPAIAALAPAWRQPPPDSCGSPPFPIPISLTPWLEAASRMLCSGP